MQMTRFVAGQITGCHLRLRKWRLRWEPHPLQALGLRCLLRTSNTVLQHLVTDWRAERRGCRLYAGVVRSNLLYGASIWAADLEANRRSFLLVRRFHRTVAIRAVYSRVFPSSSCRPWQHSVQHCSQTD